MTDRLKIDIADHVARVTLTRADKHNAMDFPMLDAVLAAQRELHGVAGLRAVILQGDGPSFCSGLDFKSVLADKKQAAIGYAKLWSPVRNDFQRWSMGWRDLPLPVIAVIHGNCFGAGMQLALGADFRITTPDAKLSILEAKWGLVPDMGGAALLRELIPIDRAKELTLTGRVLSGVEALTAGLVSHIADDPLAKAQELIAEIITRSPDSVAAGKFLMQSAWNASEAGALGQERRRQRQLLGSENQRIAVKRNTGAAETPYAPRKIRR